LQPESSGTQISYGYHQNPMNLRLYND